jgi:hypothetical protein
VFDYYLRWNRRPTPSLYPSMPISWGQPVCLHNTSPELDRPAEVSASIAGIIRVWIANLESQRERRTRVATDTLAAEGFHRVDFQTFDPRCSLRRGRGECLRLRRSLVRGPRRVLASESGKGDASRHVEIFVDC